MHSRPILLWASVLLKPFGLVIRAVGKAYKRKQRFDISGLIVRKNETGKFYIDENNLLEQDLTEGVFVEKETGEVKRTPKPSSEKFLSQLCRLDKGIDSDENA